MPSYYPPKKNTQYILYIGLASQANATAFQNNPTIAAGDFKVSTDGGALGNLGTLPVVTPASSKMVKITLSTSEMNGDNVTLVGSDAAGAEWRDIIINIQTAAQQIDDLATQASVNTVDDFLDTEIAAIKAKTDNLPTDPADASDIASSFTTVNTKLDTIDDFLDTEIADIKAKTDNLPSAPAAVSDIPTAAAIADAVLDEAMTEPSATFTWAGATLRTVVAWLGALSRNRLTQTATTSTLRNDADSSNLSTSAVSDNGTTFTRGEWT